MYRQGWGQFRKVLGAGFVAVLLAAAAHSQVQVGDNLRMTLNGNLGVGYGGSFSDSPGAPTAEPNTHNLFTQGQGLLNGSYYDPNFLSFSVQPYWNRNQENTSSASAFSSTGIDASANFFGGSHFPGSVSFSRVYNEGSQYGIFSPGTPASLSASGTTQNVNITWSALFPKWPILNFTWADSALSQTIYGETGNTDSHIKLFELNS